MDPRTDVRIDAYLRELEATIAGLREQLRARHGWTHLQLDLQLVVESGRLRVSGSVAVTPMVEVVRATLEPLLFEGLELELAVEALAPRAWYEIPSSGLQLWAQHPSQVPQTLATELHAEDGPVGDLAHEGAGMLLRARDGTTGWATGLLGAPTEPRPLTGPTQDAGSDDYGARVLAAARTYLGVPYRLGGASTTHIDCSALVQRAYVEGVGVLLPRNSHDQLALAAGGKLRGSTEGAAAGDLLFIHSRRMQRLHVGILSGEGMIVQASRTRDAVVEQPVVEFQLDAEWMRHVARGQLDAWARANVGRDFLELPKRERLEHP